MLLAIDIGNSNIVMAIRNGDRWTRQGRVETRSDYPEEIYRTEFRSFFRKAGISPGRIEKIIIGSVVPPLTEPVAQLCKELTGQEAFILTASAETGIEIGRKEVGADLIADAVAAYDFYKTTSIVVDFGTATTVMAIKEPGIFVGGAICPGLRVTYDALVGKTALLPDIPLEAPPHTIGSNTIEAMQSGVVLGHLCMAEGLVSRMKQQLGVPAKVMATGGLAPLLVPHSDCFDDMDSMLTLDGLRLIMERQKG